MWNPEDNLLFLKYCPNARDKCFHAMEADTSARPSELLKLRIKDIEFVNEEADGGGSSRYARIVLNGKTGERVVPLIDSIPYVAQWISMHPQGANIEAVLFPSKTGQRMSVERMRQTYNGYKEYFKELLDREDVPDGDKKKIRDLIKRRFNTYVHRHSAITQKSEILSDAELRQYSGWTPRSNMHYRYQHFNGGESMKSLLKYTER